MVQRLEATALGALYPYPRTMGPREKVPTVTTRCNVVGYVQKISSPDTSCSTDAERPTKYLPSEFVKIRVVPLKPSAVCKNLIARLNKPVDFMEEATPVTKRLQTEKWQNNEDLTFEQKERFFQYGALYTAVFSLEVLGSYLSVIGEDLVMNFNVMCFFKIDPPYTVVSVGGGSGTYDCSKPVEFRPVQTEPAFDTKLFTLRWSCTFLEGSRPDQCQPVDTEWGIKTYTLDCDRVYLFKLEPFHEYFDMTSPVKSNAGKPFVWTVETGWGASHIGIRCTNTCFMMNPENEIDLEAMESPQTDRDLIWRMFEGDQAAPMPLSEYSNKLTNKRTLSIKRGSLKPSSRYRMVVESSKGRGEITFDTNSPPRNGTCSVEPTFGIKGDTEFTVSCKNWTANHNPIFYTVGVPIDGLHVTLAGSFYPDKIPPFVLHFNMVRVTIQDGTGMAASVDLKVVLLHLSVHNVVTIHSKGDFSLLKNEAITNSMIASADRSVTTQQKIAILRSVLLILPHSRTSNDLEGLIGSVRMVLKHPGNLDMKDGVHELISLAGHILLLASNVLVTLGKIGHSQVQNGVIALMSVADVLFQTRDPFLLEDSTASLDVQEVHRHKVKLGVKAALEALGIVLGGARSSMIPNFGPVRYDIGTTIIFTSVGHAKTLQTQLDELGQTTATVRLTERAVARMGEDTYAVEVIVTGKAAYWWKPVSGQVLNSEFFKWHHQSQSFRPIQMVFGPFDIPINIDPDFNYVSVRGVANRAIAPCDNQSNCQRFVTIHRIKLPPGQGAVSIEVDQDHFGQIKMITIQDSVPTYAYVDSVRPVNRAKVVIKYNNQGIRLISNFYVAVISAKHDMYRYEFNVRLGRCAYYVSEEWQSQGCQFKGIIKSKDGNYSAACECSHLSTVGYQDIFPVPDLPNFDDLSLLFSLKDNWIVVAVMGLIVALFFLLLIFGVFKDRQDHKKEALRELPDNYPGDTYPYIVIIVTGMRCNAGSSSNVAFQLFGSRSASRTHLLKGGQLKNTLNRGGDDWLLLFTRKELGDIQEILVWHSNTGISPDWYCSQITVFDVNNDKPYAFKVRRWFKIDPQNLDGSQLWLGEVNRVDWEVRETKPMRICGDRFVLSLKDEHNWANIFLRHPRSVFNRTERVAALGSMIFTAMLSSIVFFGSGDVQASDVPGVSFSLSDIPKLLASWVVGLVIGRTLSLLTLSLFSLSKHKLKKPIFGPPVYKRRCCGLCKVKQKAELFDLIPITTKEGLKARDAAKPSRLKFLRCLAWVVILVFILVFTFFIILYGLKFGTKRSVLWIQTVIASLLLDAIILAPAKMAYNAYIVSRRQGALAHDYFMEIDPETLWPAPMNYYQRMERMWCRLRQEYKPFSRRRLLKMSKSRAVSDFFHQYVVYLIFLGIMLAFILFFIQTFHTKERYLANMALHRQLTEPRVPGVFYPTEIVTAEEFVDYVNKTLLTSLHRHKWYNGEPLQIEPSEKLVKVNDSDAGYKGWCIGLLNKLHGVPRLRQLRMTNKPWKIIDINFTWWQFEWGIDLSGSVSPYFAKYFDKSLGPLDTLNEDDDTYKAGWAEYNPATDANLTNLWTHSSIAETLTGAYFGDLQSFHGITYVHYRGTGYVRLLYWSRAVSSQRLFETINHGWIDNRTRAVFVEINLYNVHLNFFATLVVIAERAASGVFNVHVNVNSATLTVMFAFTNTWMYMTYILIPLLILYTIHYLQESSVLGVATFLSWKGLVSLAIILVAFYVVKLNFDKATRFNVFSDTLDTSPRDRFTPLYVPLYTDFVTEQFCACFGLGIVAALATVVYRLLGHGNFKRMYAPVQTFMVATVVVNFLVNFRACAGFRTLGIVNLDMRVVDTFFKSMPHVKLQSLSPKEQSIVILFIPFCFFFLKSLMGAFIFYYDHGADEKPPKIGLSAMFVRRATDPGLHKELDKQDKVLEKKMAVVTSKLLQVRKKYKNKKGVEDLYVAKRKKEEDQAKEEPVPKGWLESVWGGQAGNNLEELEEERYKEVKLPDDLKKSSQAKEYVPPELQAFKDKNKAETDEPPPDQNMSMLVKPTAAEPPKDEQKKADGKKKSEDKKKSEAPTPNDEKKSGPSYMGGEKPQVPTSADKSKPEAPKSADKKSLVPTSADENKSIYKDAEDRKKSEVPKPADDKKKSEIPISADDKKSLVPKAIDDKRKSKYKDAEDRKKSEVPKSTDKKSVDEDTDYEKSEVPKVEDKKEPETTTEPKKSKLSSLLKKMSDARKSKAPDAREPGDSLKEKESKSGATGKEAELGVTKGEGKPGTTTEGKAGGSGMPAVGAAKVGMKPGSPAGGKAGGSSMAAVGAAKVGMKPESPTEGKAGGSGMPAVGVAKVGMKPESPTEGKAGGSGMPAVGVAKVGMKPGSPTEGKAGGSGMPAVGAAKVGMKPGSPAGGKAGGSGMPAVGAAKVGMKPGSPTEGKAGGSGMPASGAKPGVDVSGASALGTKPGVGGPGAVAPKSPPSLRPGGPGAGKTGANVTWENTGAGGTGPQTGAKPEAPPPRKPVYMGPGITRPGVSGTSPPVRLPPPGAGKSAPSPQESSLGASRTGPPSEYPTPPGPLTPGEPRPRRPLDWLFERAKRNAPPEPAAPPVTSEPAMQSSKQLPQKRPHPGDAPPPRKPVYMGPGIPRPGFTGVSPPERLVTAPPGSTPLPGGPQQLGSLRGGPQQPGRQPPPGASPLLGSPQQPGKSPGGPQQPGIPPGGPLQPGRQPPRGATPSPGSPPQPRRSPGAPQQPGRQPPRGATPSPGGPLQPGRQPPRGATPSPGGPQQPGIPPGAPQQPGRQPPRGATPSPGGPQQPGIPPGVPQQPGRQPPTGATPPPGSPQQPGRLPGGPQQPGRSPGGPQQPGIPPGGPLQPGRQPPPGPTPLPGSPQQPSRPPTPPLRWLFARRRR